MSTATKDGQRHELARATHPQRPRTHEPRLADRGQALLATASPTLLPLWLRHRLRRTPLPHHCVRQTDRQPEGTRRRPHSQQVRGETPRLDRGPNQCAVQHSARVSGVQQSKRSETRPTSEATTRATTMAASGLPLPLVSLSLDRRRGDLATTRALNRKNGRPRWGIPVSRISIRQTPASRPAH